MLAGGGGGGGGEECSGQENEHLRRVGGGGGLRLACLHGSPVSSQVKNGGGPKGEKKKGTVTWAVREAQRWGRRTVTWAMREAQRWGRQAARVGRAGWGLGRGSEKSSTGHRPDGAGSKAPWGSLPAHRAPQ